METILLNDAHTPSTDAALMQALHRLAAPADNQHPMAIGVENDDGHVYRVVRTNGLCEAVRIFESARQLGFAIAGGRHAANTQLQKTLRWVGN